MRLGADVLFGRAPVLAALTVQKRRLGRLHVLKDCPHADVLQAATAAGVAIRRHASRNSLAHVLCSSDRVHQGVVLEAGPVPVQDAAAATRSPAPDAVAVVMDQVQDPMNLGAVLRTLHWLGGDDALAIMCRRNSCPLSATVSKASSGAMELLPLAQVASLPRFLRSAREAGWTVYGTGAVPAAGPTVDKATAAQDVREAALAFPAMLVLGNEGKGMRPLVKQQCDVMLGVGRPGSPARHSQQLVDSLNVSVAAGILLEHVFHARQQVHHDHHVGSDSAR